MTLFNKPNTDDLINEYNKLESDIDNLNDTVEIFNLLGIGSVSAITAMLVLFISNFKIFDVVLLSAVIGTIIVMFCNIFLDTEKITLFNNFLPAYKKQKCLTTRSEIIKSELMDSFSDLNWQHQFFTKMHLTINQLNKYKKSEDRDALIVIVKDLKACLGEKDYEDFFLILVENATSLNFYESVVSDAQQEESYISDIDYQLNAYSRSRGLPPLPTIEKDIEPEVETFRSIL